MSTRRRSAPAWLLACCAASTAVRAGDDLTRAKAFDEGKAYKPANTAIQERITPGAASAVPGRDAPTAGALEGLYGGRLDAPGRDKQAACAAYRPGTDAYKNQECDVINYVSGNQSLRPGYTIARATDPVIARGEQVRSAPLAHTSGATGLAGAYSACTSHTTSRPARHESERCMTGKVVTEAQCTAELKVSYSWQRYTGQPAAEIRYGRCPAGEVRGDRLAIPQASGYRTEPVPCASRRHGIGTELLIWHDDCAGESVLHGFDATACSAKPTPGKADPPRTPATVCASAPRVAENCFTPAGRYASKVEAPVFKDVWDDSTCDGVRGPNPPGAD